MAQATLCKILDQLPSLEPDELRQLNHAVLERLGFKTQREDVMAKAKKKEKKVALASKSQVLKASEKFRKDVIAKNGKNEAVVSADSRNQLMEKVKAQGIKNFRVMNVVLL